jgi:ATP-binding cassette, subfamily G (WHITE), member 2, PDR
MGSANTFLERVGASADPAAWWRDFGVVLAFALFNVAAAFLLYWVARVPLRRGEGRVREGRGLGLREGGERKV